MAAFLSGQGEPEKEGEEQSENSDNLGVPMNFGSAERVEEQVGSGEEGEAQDI
jgi:hypothetical protein